jgi:hypothetical protein
MGTSKDDEHRKIAAKYAEKWGVDPDTVLWEGALHFDQSATYPAEFTWSYLEFQRDEDGMVLRHPVSGELVFETRKRPIPEAWIEEYEAEVRDLYQG